MGPSAPRIDCRRSQAVRAVPFASWDLSVIVPTAHITARVVTRPIGRAMRSPPADVRTHTASTAKAIVATTVAAADEVSTLLTDTAARLLPSEPIEPVSEPTAVLAVSSLTNATWPATEPTVVVVAVSDSSSTRSSCSCDPFVPITEAGLIWTRPSGALGVRLTVGSAGVLLVRSWVWNDPSVPPAVTKPVSDSEAALAERLPMPKKSMAPVATRATRAITVGLRENTCPSFRAPNHANSYEHSITRILSTISVAGLCHGQTRGLIPGGRKMNLQFDRDHSATTNYCKMATAKLIGNKK